MTAPARHAALPADRPSHRAARRRHAALALAAAIALALAPRPGFAVNPITVRPPADAMCAASTGRCTPAPYVAIMSAFPAELEPVIALADVDETIVVDGRTYYLGTLSGARVVMVLAGIGLVNAETTTRTLLDRFEVKTIVFSGVAGSRQNIGDVVVPAHWSDTTAVFDADPALLALVQPLTAPAVPLEACTFHPVEPPGDMVCLGRTPQIVVGGDGESTDPFNGGPLACNPTQNPVAIFGCEVRPAAVDRAIGNTVGNSGANAAADPSTLDAQDMETAAMARVATAAGVPFIAFRGVSDGPGDPLNLGGFPNQFFAYYQIAADNAAATVAAFLNAWPQKSGPADPYARGRATLAFDSGVGAACEWERAAGPACANALAPRVVTKAVAEACALLLQSTETTLPAGKLRRAGLRARKRWRAAARHVAKGRLPAVGDACRQILAPALLSRSKPPPAS